MTTLTSGFEADLEAAVLDDAEARLRAELGPRLVALARDRWEAYASRNDYDIEHIWQDADLEVTRDGDTVQVSVQWPELTALFEFGVSPHVIEGDPVLHFYYERIGEEITVSSVNWGSETGGIPESRAIRDALRQFRREVSE
jgi:hypothetical protein